MVGGCPSQAAGVAVYGEWTCGPERIDLCTGVVPSGVKKAPQLRAGANAGLVTLSLDLSKPPATGTLIPWCLMYNVVLRLAVNGLPRSPSTPPNVLTYSFSVSW